MISFDDGLEPADRGDFGEYVSRFVRDEYAALQDSLQQAVWQPLPKQSREYLNRDTLPRQAASLDEVVAQFRTHIRPYGSGNTHPRFFGWVQGSGTVASVLAEFAAALMNPNCGGREHAAVHVERLVIDWCRQIFSMPQHAGGLLTSGTSASTHLAVQLALHRKLGDDYIEKGLHAGERPLRCYCSAEGHSSILKAVQACGLGRRNLVQIATEDDKKINLSALGQQIRQDLAAGFLPLMVVGNAGTVNSGAFDDLPALRALCFEHDCWFHVDGAYGAWMTLAGLPYTSLTTGIDSADSLAFDFHKLMYVTYDCGALLVRDQDRLPALFSVRPDYLAPHGRALAGGDPWFSELGLELSRGFRALKVWFTFKTYGLEKLGQAIQRNCELAVRLADLVRQSEHFVLVQQPPANIVVFRLRQIDDPARHNALSEALVTELQMSGEAVFSLTRDGEYRVIRASITNHRTSAEDIQLAFGALEIRASVALLGADTANDP